MLISVSDFGANGKNGALQTKIFQNAIDFCYKNGGGEVVVPAGNFLLGGIRIRSNITLRLKSGAKLIASRNVEDYSIIYSDDIDPVPEDFLPENTLSKGRKKWYNAFILIYKEKNVSIIGEKNSFIDGSNCYDPDGEEKYRGPHAITVLKSENILLKGYTIVNSANWGHNIWCCKQINCMNVTVKGGHDGIDFFGSEQVRLSDCNCYTGDDCIAGFDNKDVLIENCILNSSCSAFRFCGTNVLINNCNVYGPGEFPHRNSLSLQEKADGVNIGKNELKNYRHNMLSFFTYYADMRLVFRHKPSNIVIKNCSVNNCDRFLHYNFSGSERWQSNMPLSDIRFENVKASGTVLPINLYGDKNDKVSLYVRNSEINFSDGTSSRSMINAANAERIILENVTCNLKGEAIVFGWKEIGQINITGGNLAENFNKTIKFPDFDFATVSGMEI